MNQVAVLLRAGMRACIHREATQDTSRTAGRDDDFRLFTDCRGLLLRHPAKEPRTFRFISFDVIGEDDHRKALVIEPDFQPADPELISCRRIENVDAVETRLGPFLGGQLCQHLLQRFAERIELNLLHPGDRRLAPGADQQPEPPLTRFANRLDKNEFDVSR